MVALILNDEQRIVALADEKHCPLNSVLVKKLPEGCHTDYKYIDGEFIFEPLPKKEVKEEPSVEERLSNIEAFLAKIRKEVKHGGII